MPSPEVLNSFIAKVETNELAYQRWEGDQVVEEKFFYDPGQVARS
jgi:hypothetical protein